jgi:hypothetical protein
VTASCYARGELTRFFAVVIEREKLFGSCTAIQVNNRECMLAAAKLKRPWAINASAAFNSTADGCCSNVESASGSLEKDCVCKIVPVIEVPLCPD